MLFKKSIFFIALMMTLLFIAAGCNNASSSTDRKASEPVFNIGGIPDQDVSVLARRFGKVAEYLSEETGLNVKYVASQDYAALVSAFQRGDIHLAWFGGLTGVQARNGVSGAEAIAQRPTDSQFQSVFIVQKRLDDVKRIEDLKGLSFAFGSESSTSGHLMPRYFMIEAGIDPLQDLDGRPNFTGSHDKTWKLVESGAYQAGALNKVVWDSRVEQGEIDTDKVKAFYTTPEYYDYHWTINNVDQSFGEGTKQKVIDALLSMTPEDQDNILSDFQTTSFVSTDNDNYRAIEEVARQIGVIK